MIIKNFDIHIPGNEVYNKEDDPRWDAAIARITACVTPKPIFFLFLKFLHIKAKNGKNQKGAE